MLDREFSYLELLLCLNAEQVNFVIRLNLGSHPPKFWDAEGQEVSLTILLWFFQENLTDRQKDPSR